MWNLPTIIGLPDEVMSQIFIEAASTDCAVDYGGPLVMDVSHLTHVCRKWRRIALSTSRLWSTIHLTYPLTSHQLSRTVTYLLRSGLTSLAVYMDFRDPGWDWNESTHAFTWEMMSVIMGLLVPHISRWRALELLSDTWVPIYAFLWCTCDSPTPTKLESLSLARCNAYFVCRDEVFRPEILRVAPTLFGGLPLPRLRTVSLSGVHVDWKQSASLSGLVTLELKYHAGDVMPSMSQFGELLGSSPALQRLTMLGCNLPSKNPPSPTAPSVSSMPSAIHVSRLDHLTHLTVGYVDEDHALRCLSVLHLPALKTLELEDISASLTPEGAIESSNILQYLVIHATRLVMPQVTELVLKCIKATSSAFAAFFRVCSSLRNLTLNSVDAAAIVGLSSPAGSGSHCRWPCPGLRELWCLDMSAGTLLQMLQTRQASDLVPYNVHLDNSQGSAPTFRGHIRQLEDLGVRVEAVITDEDRDLSPSLDVNNVWLTEVRRNGALTKQTERMPANQ